MKKITVKNLIDFKRLSDRSKKTFVNNLSKEKSSNSESGGGDYWITSLSAISNFFKHNDKEFLDQKIEELNDKIEITNVKSVKDQFNRNIQILNNFKDFDLDGIRPSSELTYLKQPKANSIFDIVGRPIEAKPRFVYSFSGANSQHVGGVWFVAKLKGYNKNELGMFADVLHRFVSRTYGADYYVDPSACWAIDVTDGKKVSSQEILEGQVPSLIESTIEEIKNT